MTTEDMRVRLLERYPDSLTWPARISRMSDNQVYAVYMRIFARN